MSYWYGRQTPEELEDLRRRARENLVKIARGDYRREAMERDERRAREKAAKAQQKAWAQADAIERGHMVIEMRELMKLEQQYANRPDGELTTEEIGHWEEVDARLDRLRDELKDFTVAQLNRFARAYRKSQKRS